MNPYIFAVCLIGSYLIGSISFSRIVTKIVAPDVNLEEVKLKVPDSEQEMQLKTVGATTASIVVVGKMGIKIPVMPSSVKSDPKPIKIVFLYAGI